MTVLWDCNGGRVILNLITMSSEIPENANEGESILPEVEELSEFHPDQFSNLVDIQEELERLEASGNATEQLMSMPTVEDVNIVDHEVTIVAEQENENISILPEINHDYKLLEPEITISENENSNNKILENSDEIDPNKNNLLNCKDNELYHNNLDQLNNSELIIGQSSLIVPQLKVMRSLPVTEILKRNKSVIGVVQAKANVLTKVMFDSNNQPSSDSSIIYGDTYRIVGQNKSAVLANTSKTITVTQAKEMGIFSSGKLQQILPNHSKGIIKKSVMINPSKPFTMVKSSPTKILPLPPGGQLHSIAPSLSPIKTMSVSATPHKLFLRQPSTSVKSGNFSGTILATSAGNQGPILQLPVSQDNTNQIHQIHLPGKQVQYVRLVTSNAPSGSVTSQSSTGDTVNKAEPFLLTQAVEPPISVALTPNTSTTNSHLKMVPIAPAQPVSSVSPNTSSFERVLVSPGLNQLTARPDAKPPTSNVVMVPAEYVKQYKPLPIHSSPPSPPQPVEHPPPPLPPPPLLSKNKEVTNKEALTTPTSQRNKLPAEPPNGIRPRKPCNCTKSQCLKLYCDCFANGEFCFQCNCNCCFNNLDHEEERQRAIKSCLERNPNAFRPKIGKGYIGDERRHNKGCNCKRSGCLKNYCECYEAKISCSNNCKCIGCRNTEEIKDKNSEGGKINHQIVLKNKLSSEIEESAFKPNNYLNNQGVRQPFSLMTHEVVQATCQCLLAQVVGDHPTEHVERKILEEFGRCLVQIINCATRTTVNNP